MRTRQVVVSIVMASGVWLGVQSAVAEVATGSFQGDALFHGRLPEVARLSTGEKDAVCGAGKLDKSLNVKDGKLAGVVVFLQGDLPASDSSRAVEILIDACDYSPRVQLARVGSRLTVRNNDPMPHNVVGYLPPGKSFFNFYQPIQGSKNVKLLNTQGLLEIRGGNDEPWAAAYVYVLPHDFARVTADDGHFQLNDIPAGHYQVTAWHERLGTLTQTIDVTAGKTTSSNFSFEPRAGM